MTTTFERPIIIIDAPTPASPSPTPAAGAPTDGVKPKVSSPGDTTLTPAGEGSSAGDDNLGGLAAVCPDGVPWCIGDPDWHDEDESEHDSGFAVLPTGDEACTRHDEQGNRRANEVWLSLEREDVAGQPGTPAIYLAPNNSADQFLRVDEAHLGLDAAERLADELLRLVALARGSKRAKDVRVGDVLVIDGVEQAAVIVLHDSECCADPNTGEHECSGSIGIQTDRCADGEWARTYDLDELVQVRAEVIA